MSQVIKIKMIRPAPVPEQPPAVPSGFVNPNDLMWSENPRDTCAALLVYAYIARSRMMAWRFNSKKDNFDKMWKALESRNKQYDEMAWWREVDDPLAVWGCPIEINADTANYRAEVWARAWMLMLIALAHHHVR